MAGRQNQICCLTTLIENFSNLAKSEVFTPALDGLSAESDLAEVVVVVQSESQVGMTVARADAEVLV